MQEKMGNERVGCDSAQQAIAMIFGMGIQGPAIGSVGRGTDDRLFPSEEADKQWWPRLGCSQAYWTLPKDGSS